MCFTPITAIPMIVEQNVEIVTIAGTLGIREFALAAFFILSV